MSNSNCNTGQDLKSLRGKMPTEPLIVEGLCVETECGVVLTCVTKTTTYEPKGKLSYTSETVYTDKDGAIIEGKEVACPIKVEIVSPPVEPPVPPGPITLEGQDCSGAAKPATGLPGQLTQIVQAPGQVLSVRMCSDDAADFELACGVDPNTGHTVQTAYKIVAGQFIVINRWDVVTGLAWTGDPATLESCAGVTQESDPREVCVDGSPLTQWIVMEAGLPTGTVFYTNNAGQLVDVAPGAVVTLGQCVIADLPKPAPEISDAFGNDLSSLLPSDNFIFDASKACSSPPCVYQIVTDAGTFRVRAGSAITTKTFSSKVTVQSVSVLSGGCSLADLHIIGNSN